MRQNVLQSVVFLFVLYSFQIKSHKQSTIRGYSVVSASGGSPILQIWCLNVPLHRSESAGVVSAPLAV